MSAAYKQWSDVSKESSHHKHVVRSCLFKMQNKLLSGVFQTWADNVDAAIRHRQDEERKHLAATRMLKRMMNAQLSAMYNQWVAFTEEVKHNRVVVARCLAKIKNRAAAAAFLQWHELTETVKAQRVAVGRALMRMKQRVVLECWDGWLEAMDNAAENRKKEAEEQKEKQRQEAVMRKVMKRAFNGALTRAWNMWH